jgi:hypothetical protein
MRYVRVSLVTRLLAAASWVVAQDSAWRAIHDWAKMPEGRAWGSTSTPDVDRNGN